MDTIGSRLRQARIDANFTSARAAAMRFGWSPSTYAAHENGQNKFGADIASEYARAFGTNTTWLLFGYQNEGKVFLLPVTALVFSPDNVQTIDPQMGNGRSWSFKKEEKWTYHYAECDIAFPQFSVAFEIKGHGMWPKYENGDLLVSGFGSDLIEANGRENLILTEDGVNRLRILIHRGEKCFDLQAHNVPPIRDVDVKMLWRVNFVVKAGNWKALTPDDPQWARIRSADMEDASSPRLKLE